MYTGEADHALTAELVERVSVPVIASGDITTRRRALDVLAATGCAAVMVGRAAQGNPWVLAEIMGESEAARPSREDVAGELLFFMGETVRELGEHRATGFLKKFYGWYLGGGRFPKPFKQELVQLRTVGEVEKRLLAATPGAAEIAERLRDEIAGLDELMLPLPISAYGGGWHPRGCGPAADAAGRQDRRPSPPPGGDTRRLAGASRAADAPRAQDAEAAPLKARAPTRKGRPTIVPMAVVAQRRIVTVLFADIVGSTAIGETLGPERSKLLVDEVMRLLSREVERFEGTVAQFVGDELYALFGAPVAHEDDSERAVLAALAMQRALTRYAAEVREAYGIDLAVRIAINTGPVVIDPESEDPYNALGETVNTAARIQELASGGEIVVGAATRSQVEHCFELEQLG